MTIDAIMITNHSVEIKKIKIIKKMLDAKNYVIDNLRLRQAVKKVFDFDKKNDARNTSTIEKTNNHENNKEEEKKKMTDEQQKNEANDENEQEKKKKNEREQNEI